MTNQTPKTTFRTKIWVTLPNVETLYIKSPKTGQSIHIYQGWFSSIPEEIAKKLWSAWSSYQSEATKFAKANPDNRYARTHFEREVNCLVDLTVEDFKSLYALHQAQQKKLAAGSPNRRNRR